MIKYNFGSGLDIREDYKNVDARSYRDEIDIQYDLTKVPYSFADNNSAEEILAKNILEYFPYRETVQILKEWYDILQEDGKLLLQVPNGGKMMEYFANDKICDCVPDKDPEGNYEADPKCFACGGEGEVSRKNWLYVFTGKQEDKQWDIVKNVFTKERIDFYLGQAGFSDYEINTTKYQFRIIAKK